MNKQFCCNSCHQPHFQKKGAKKSALILKIEIDTASSTLTIKIYTVMNSTAINNLKLIVFYSKCFGKICQYLFFKNE